MSNNSISECYWDGDENFGLGNLATLFKIGDTAHWNIHKENILNDNLTQIKKIKIENIEIKKIKIFK